MYYYTDKKPEYYELGETYLKLDFEYNNENKALLKYIYLKKLKGISKEFLKSSKIKISIEFDKGSLKTKIKIWGLLLYVIIQYGNFRQGVREMVTDMKNLSEYVIQLTENEQLIHRDRILRSERRTGVMGRINNIYRRIDKLERNLNSLSQDEIREELNSIKQEVSNIGVILPENINQQFLDGLTEDYRNNLPEPNERKAKYLMSRYALKPDDEFDFIEE